MSDYQIPDSVVEAAAKALYEETRKAADYVYGWDDVRTVHESYRDAARPALQAALKDCNVGKETANRKGILSQRYVIRTPWGPIK